MKRGNVVILILALLMMLVSCGGNDKKIEEQKNEVVFANFRDIRDLNPHNYAGELYAQNMLYEGLVKINPEGEIIPWLAEKWEITDDGKSYTFFLRKDVVFSDGEKFNAKAVKANFDAIMDNKERHGWLESVRLFEKFEEVDEYTFRLTLKEPYFPMLTELGVIRPFRFISPKAMKNGTTKNGVDGKYIGTGPYVLKQNAVDQEAVFEVNEKYWGEKPKIKTVRVKVIPDVNTRSMALEKGELDIIFGRDMIDAETVNRFKDKKGFKVKLSEPLATRMLMVNTTKGALKDKKVRQALQHVIDKKAVSEGIFSGIEAPADTLFSKNIPYADINLKPYGYSLEMAGKLLDEAGWKLGKDGKREKEGKNLVITLNYDSDSVSEKSISEYFKDQLNKIGVELKIAGEEEQSNRDRKNKGDFEITFATSWGTPYDPVSFLGAMTHFPGHGEYMAQRGLPNIDEMNREILEALKTTDENKRKETFTKVFTILHDEGVYIPLTYEKNRVIYKEILKNVEFEISPYEIPFYMMSY